MTTSSPSDRSRDRSEARSGHDRSASAPLSTPLCRLLNITHPVVLGGMGNATTPDLVAAVSNAGGLGVQSTSRRGRAQVEALVQEIQAATSHPFGLNLLLFTADAETIDATLAAGAPVFSTAWARPDQDLRALFQRAHAAGSLAMHMVSTVDDAARAAEAGADVIVAQGTEGGGHVGQMASMVLVPMAARAVAPLPVLAAGGVADGAGLAAALALGAQGVLLGTRFLATPEAPLHPAYKQAIVDSNGHDTLLTEIPDIANGEVWPGAYVRVARNRFIERWIGREGEVRRRQLEIRAQMQRARAEGDVDEGVVSGGQAAGLIDRVEPAGDVVRRITSEAADILRRCAALTAAEAVQGV